MVNIDRHVSLIKQEAMAHQCAIGRTYLKNYNEFNDLGAKSKGRTSAGGKLYNPKIQAKVQRAIELKDCSKYEENIFFHKEDAKLSEANWGYYLR